MKKYMLGLYEKAMPGSLDWKQKLEAAKSFGYDYIEMSIDETDEKLKRLAWSRRERQELLYYINETEMRIQSICLSGHRRYPLGSEKASVRARGMEIMEQAIRLAVDLGIRIIQLAGYDVYYEASTQQTVKYFAENLEKAVELAAASGVLLGFETMETEFMNTVEKSMKYVKLMNSPYLGVYPDAGNLKNASLIYGTDVYNDLQSGEGHIIALHLKETVLGKFREIPFGTGHVDFEKTINTAWRMGTRLYVTEMWYVGQKSWKEEIQEAHDNMRVILEKQS